MRNIVYEVMQRCVVSSVLCDGGGRPGFHQITPRDSAHSASLRTTTAGTRAAPNPPDRHACTALHDLLLALPQTQVAHALLAGIVSGIQAVGARPDLPAPNTPSVVLSAPRPASRGGGLATPPHLTKVEGMMLRAFRLAHVARQAHHSVSRHASAARPLAVRGMHATPRVLRAVEEDDGALPDLISIMRSKIQDALGAQEVEVLDASGDCRHVQIHVIASAFEGKRPVQRQQLVYKVIPRTMPGDGDWGPREARRCCCKRERGEASAHWGERPWRWSCGWLACSPLLTHTRPRAGHLGGDAERGARCGHDDDADPRRGGGLNPGAPPR